ncbi:hypothetical protein UCDDS831_g03140 [Diplodia seriata]|uniref:Uncharacterized protein n=1 Tax=Diplodia seriata TaxID=420778 RepID=A0A0G2EM74_9PEZI|nr:hypothetical protein UCDDS831_g03140 [Diplodia seriata]
MATAHPTTDHEDEPPSYTTTFPERDPLRTDVIKAACRALDHRAHSPFGSADARSIDRLRNWLCYMLTVDYKVATASTPVTLSAADAAHFDNLFATLEAYSNINATTTTTQPHTKKTAAATATADAAEHDDRAAALESAFWTHIHLPSQALNIPTATVALYLRRFAVNKTAPLATYAGSDAATVVLETTHGGGMRGWAAKLLTDRSILVPRVAPNRGVEQGLLRAIAELVEAWFVRLDGFECRVVEAQRRELRSWRKEGEGEEDRGDDADDDTDSFFITKPSKDLLSGRKRLV